MDLKRLNNRPKCCRHWSRNHNNEVVELLIRGSNGRITTFVAVMVNSQVALPMTSRRLDIGAVVLIDPIPFQAMYTEAGRLNVLKRYWESLRSSPDYGLALKILDDDDGDECLLAIIVGTLVSEQVMDLIIVDRSPNGITF